jgi:murein L,D-transpeptidase YcbB/YkuD
VREASSDLRPRRPEYRILVKALADLREIQAHGGWAAIPDGPTLRPGDWDPRVPLLRRRLAPASAPSESLNGLARVFDTEVEVAVRSFQRTRGLDETGVVDEATVAALNVPVEALIDGVRVNLERLRWLDHELPDTFVEVNAASAMLRVVAADGVALESRVIVGAEDTPTPELRADILHVTLNPTWTVPPGIVEEVLSAARRDPDYLRSQGIRIIDGFGRDIDPAGVDLSKYEGPDFPYRFQQDAGPLNPLGRIKLNLPNGYFVYLHDTPARHLFASDHRYLSHGCVRVQDPLGLAELLLRDPQEWSRAALEAAIATGETRTIALPGPVPVLSVYWTVEATRDGEVRYHPDTYGRDGGVLSTLDAGPADGTQPGSGR